MPSPTMHPPTPMALAPLGVLVESNSALLEAMDAAVREYQMVGWATRVGRLTCKVPSETVNQFKTNCRQAVTLCVARGALPLTSQV